MPEKHAEIIFKESLVALLAHTIRGVENYFLKHQVQLSVKIRPDTANSIFTGNKNTATSVLWSWRAAKVDGEYERVNALIYIRKDANRHLARVCIAHEIYHLLLELNAYLKSGRREWPQIQTSAHIEDQCNLFAWRLCYYHDKFYEDQETRDNHTRFPKHLFDKPLNLSNIGNLREWAEGIALDREHPFTQIDLPLWLKDKK